MSLEQRIRRDARLVAGDKEASALLACLAEHLFEADLDATFLDKRCGASRPVRDRLAAKRCTGSSSQPPLRRSAQPALITPPTRRASQSGRSSKRTPRPARRSLRAVSTRRRKRGSLSS